MARFIVWFTRSIKRKALWAFLFTLLLLAMALAAAYYPPFKPTVQLLPLAGRAIALDPGHGGYDPGGGAEGVLEKDVTLEISLWLRDLLVEAGCRVFLTREDDRDLLVVPAGPKKQQDLENRLKLISEAQVDILVSIHANSIASPRWYGAQTFYREECEDSRRLALLIQEEIVRTMKNTTRKASIGKGNYFLLEHAPVPAAIVEVGFLSNPRERRLLTEPSYQKKMAWSIYLGLIRYFRQPRG
jgi:N-acetylmuramoyl-L-alanine amidase